MQDGNGGSDGGGQLLSIGAVLGVLRDEFPEVTISKIRFLEAERLVEPERTPSGYRKFSRADVTRLGYVLRMQRDHYLPLRVIREYLDALDAGEEPPALPGAELSVVESGSGPRGAVSLLAGRSGDDPTGRSLDLVVGQEPPRASGPSAGPAVVPGPRLGRAELLAAAGVAEKQLADWESYGLVVPTPDGGYDPEMLQVARLVAELGRFGLEPRHLRAVKAAADREVGLVEQVVAPLRRHRNPQTRAHAATMARELATLSVRLHAALVQVGLRARPGV